jgi:hypothetical protein
MGLFHGFGATHWSRSSALVKANDDVASDLFTTKNIYLTSPLFMFHIKTVV